jgi:energy-coupling factor transport system permease protein
LPGHRNGSGFGGHACRYVQADSPVHRLHAAIKLLLALGLVLAAVFVQSPPALLGLLALDCSLYLLARLGPRELWRDLRWLLLNLAVVIGLYLLNQGWPTGLMPGAITGLKVLLFFLPGALFIRTTQMANLGRELRWLLPRQLSFLLFTSLRFMPFFAREVREIAMAQRMRGARLAPRQIINPLNWGDVVRCLLLPLMVRALQTAADAADSAQARGFDLHAQAVRSTRDKEISRS